MAKKMATNISFWNREYEGEDETQFDTTDFSELAECWLTFCCENGLVGLEEVEIEEDE